MRLADGGDSCWFCRIVFLLLLVYLSVLYFGAMSSLFTFYWSTNFTTWSSFIVIVNISSITWYCRFGCWYFSLIITRNEQFSETIQSVQFRNGTSVYLVSIRYWWFERFSQIIVLNLVNINFQLIIGLSLEFGQFILELLI